MLDEVLQGVEVGNRQAVDGKFQGRRFLWD